MICAHKVGITVFATGGIGGVHRGWQASFDISTDLSELMRTPVTVICSGAKSLLDLPATMEYLETMGVPIIGLGTSELPGFFFAESGLTLQQYVSDSKQAAAIISERRALQLEGGEVIAVPPPLDTALPPSEVYPWIKTALSEAEVANISGQLLTPFVLERLRELSGDRTLLANIALIKNNARVASQIAKALKQKSPC
jgi:pseudouridine-5'-phosphate glycosidase